MLQDIVTKDSTNRSVTVKIIDSTAGTPETGVVWNTAGIDLWYRREGAVSVDVTEATLAALTTAHTDGGFLHVNDGVYRLDLPDAAFATGANYVDFGGTVTGMVVIGGRVRLVDVDLEDSVRAGLTSLPNAAADAAGGLPISDAGGLDLDTQLDAAISSRMATFTQPTGFLAATFPTTVASTTNITAGTITTTTNLTNLPAITTNWLTAAGIAASALDGKGDWNTTTPPTAVAIADQVWDEAIAGHVGAGSTGESLNNASAPTAAAVADAVWDEAQSGHVGAGTFGEIATEIAAILVDTADLQANQGNWLTATGFSTHTALDVWHVAAASVVTASTIGLQVKTNVDAVLSNIETDTQDLQTQIGTAGAGLTDLGGMSTGMKAEVESEANDAMVVLQLDHLLHVADASTTTNNSIIAKMVSKSATAAFSSFVNTTDSLEAIADSGGGDATAANQTTLINALAVVDANVDQIEAATITNAAGVDIAADIIALKAETALILTDTAEIGAAGAGLTEAGGTGDQLTALPWNAAFDTGADNALMNRGLHYLVTTAVSDINVADNSLWAKLSSVSADYSTYDWTTDSQEAIRNKQTDIETDTADIQTQVGTAGAGLTDLGGMSTGMKAEVESEANDALVALQLDHLLHVADASTTTNNSIIAKMVSKSATAAFSSFVNTTDSLEAIADTSGGDATAANQTTIISAIGTMTDLGGGADIANNLADMAGATFATGTDSLEAIRDRGDSAWTTGAGGSDRLLMVDTTIATLASQVSFTLAGGSTDDDAYNGCTIVIEDVSTAAQKAIGIVDDYTGSTKTVTLLEDPAVFTMAATDKVYILAEKGLKPTTAANYHVDVSSGGNVGIDWANIESPTTAVDLSATDIQLCDTITTYTGNTVQTGDSFARIGAAGASLTDLGGMSTAMKAEVNAEADTALTDYDAPTNTEMVAAFTEVKGATWASGTDTLEAIRDRGDAAWVTGSGGDATAANQTTLINALAVVDANVDQIETAVITNAAGVDISADVAAVKVDTAAVLVDTADMQPKLGSPAADLAADIAAVKVDTAATLVDTGTTLPATLATIDGNVDAILVDTGTTLPATLATIDTNVDSILVDTATTIPATLTTIEGKIDTVDTNVDAILVDTGTTLPATLAGLNDISVADVWTTALTESYGTDGSALTGAQLAYLTMGNVSEFAIVSTTKTVKQLDGSTTAATYTLDSATVPTSITRAT